MTAQLAPLAVQKFFDNNGNPLAFGFLTTYAAGTTNKIASYIDSTQTTPNTNPIQLNFRGECALWLDPTLTYKILLTDQSGSTIPGWPVDNVPGGFTPSAIAQSLIPTPTNTWSLGSPVNSWANEYLGPNKAPVLDAVTGNIGYYVRTAAEIAAAVVPTNLSYPVCYVDRYGTNTTPGTTSMAAAWQAAINVAKKCGQVIRYGATAPYLIDAPLDLTAPVGSVNFGFTIRNEGHPSIAASNPAPSIILKHTGIAFDCTGTISQEFEGMSITTDATTYPTIGFLLARNTDARSQLVRFRNCQVLGNFSKTIVYNYGSEDDQYQPCSFYNRAPDANTSVMDFTSHNIRGITSTFTTIATGNQSTIDHKIFGGEYANQAGTTTSDVIRLDDVSSVKLFGPWMKCASGSADGRSLIYMDTTNGPSNTLTLIGVQGENATFLTKYGIYLGDAVRTPSYLVAISCSLPNRTKAIFANTNITCDDFHLKAVGNQGVGGGIQVLGTLQNSHIDELGLGGVAITIANSQNNIYNCNAAAVSVTNDLGGDYYACVGVQNWVPVTSGLSLGGGVLTVSHAHYQKQGSEITLTVGLSSSVTLSCAAGTALGGLPISNLADGQVIVTNSTVPSLIGAGQISGTTIILPAISVGANVRVTVTARYFVA